MGANVVPNVGGGGNCRERQMSGANVVDSICHLIMQWSHLSLSKVHFRYSMKLTKKNSSYRITTVHGKKGTGKMGI